MIHIERDPNNRKLESEVTNKLLEIYDVIEPKNNNTARDKGSVNFVSVEDAMKELIEMGEKI